MDKQNDYTDEKFSEEYPDDDYADGYTDEKYEEDYADEKYAEEYSEEKLFTKILKFAKKAGIKIIYLVLLLFYTLQKSTTPMWVKSVIIGALGYFILPIDVIPDFIPMAGYTDDYGVLIGALGATAFYIDAESKEKARKKLHDWFGEYDYDELSEVETKIKEKE